MTKESICSRLWSRAHRYYSLSNIIIIVFLLIVYLCVLSVPFERQLFERDPAHSFYSLDAEIVPASMLFFFSPVLVLIVVVLCTILHYVLLRWAQSELKLNTSRSAADLTDPFLSSKKGHALLKEEFTYVLSEHLMVVCIAFISAFSVTALVIEILKILFSKHRPGFFYYCNYQGYADGLKAGNLSSYYALTDPSRLVDLDNCWADEHSADDSHKSFPSGHSALTFCGMGFICFCALQLLEFAHEIGAYNHSVERNNKSDASSADAETVAPASMFSYISSYEALMVARMFCFTPFILSTWVAVSRIRDYKHSELDVSVGAIIGTGVAFYFISQLKDYLHSSPNTIIALIGGVKKKYTFAPQETVGASFRDDRSGEQEAGGQANDYGSVSIA